LISSAAAVSLRDALCAPYRPRGQLQGNRRKLLSGTYLQPSEQSLALQFDLVLPSAYLNRDLIVRLSLRQPP
jgi:hypothetical protein